MDQRKESSSNFYLNSEPENSYYHSEIGMSSLVDLNSVPENSYYYSEFGMSSLVDPNSVPESLNPSSHNQQTNSFSVDLNKVPDSFLFFDLNFFPEIRYHSSQNQQRDLCFRPERDNQQDNLLSKKKRALGTVEKKDKIITKKLKAECEKSRPDRLDDSFEELEDVMEVDSDRNTEGSILDDAIHVSKGLSSEVTGLKVENEALPEESRELGSEKASLKSDIEDLELQFQLGLSLMPPWARNDPLKYMHDI